MEPLIDRAQKGDADALSSLAREYYALVYRFCYRRLGNDLAADAAQETFVTMQRKIRQFEYKSQFETWLLGIAQNHCQNLARKKKRQMDNLVPWMGEVTVKSPDCNQPALDKLLIQRALQALSPEHRDVVLLHEFEGFKYAEIAKFLGVPEGTVKSRLHHAFLQMRKVLQP